MYEWMSRFFVSIFMIIIDKRVFFALIYENDIIVWNVVDFFCIFTFKFIYFFFFSLLPHQFYILNNLVPIRTQKQIEEIVIK